MHELSCAWASWIGSRYDCGFSKEHGLVEAPEPNSNADSPESVDLNALKVLKRCDSETVPELGPRFKRGDQVKLVRRTSCRLPGTDKRRDLPVGTEASVVGLSDEHGNKVIIKVLVVVEKGEDPVEVAHATVPSNLKFLGEDLEATEEPDQALGDTAAPSGQGKKRVAPWALLDSAPEQVREEPHWAKLLSDKDPLMQAFPCAAASQ